MSPIRSSASELTINEQEKYKSAYNYEQWERQQLQLSVELVAKANALKGKKVGQCVPAVRNFLGLDRTVLQGWARYAKPTSQEPQIGAVIILQDHVGGIIGLTDTQITYFDPNRDYKEHAFISVIGIGEKRIKGYIPR